MDQLRRPLRLYPFHSAARRGGVLRGVSALLVLALAAMAPAACGADAQVEWHDSFESPEALASAVLWDLAAADKAGLARYALSAHELRTTVWPHLPASRPEVGMPWDYFWRDHAQKNAGHLQMMLKEHGGKRYELAALSFAGRGQYGGVTIYRETAFEVRFAGGLKQLRLSGSMIEMRGRWKLYSYVAD